MKTIFSFLGILIIDICLAQSGFKCPNTNETAKAFFARVSNKPIIMGHRMSPLSKGFAENSLNTFLYNIRHNHCVIQEMDVRMTKDEKLVLLHDDTLDRTTTGKGKLSGYTFEELQKIYLRDGKGTVLGKEKVPTLQSILKNSDHKTILVLDKKPGTNPDLLMKEINQYKKLNQVLVICYNITEAKKLHQEFPTLMIALGFNTPEQIEENKKSDIPYSNIVALVPQKIETDDFYVKIKQLNIPISFSAQGIVDMENDALTKYPQLYKKGFNIICTDSINTVKKSFN